MGCRVLGFGMKCPIMRDIHGHCVKMFRIAFNMSHLSIEFRSISLFCIFLVRLEFGTHVWSATESIYTRGRNCTAIERLKSSYIANIIPKESSLSQSPRVGGNPRSASTPQTVQPKAPQSQRARTTVSIHFWTRRGQFSLNSSISKKNQNTEKGVKIERASLVMSL